MKFEWSEDKNKRNLKKHGFDFKEASELFTGRSDFLELFDEEHSGDEDRFIAIGHILRGVIVVIFVERNLDTVRIISARKATKSEVELFDKFQRGDL